jgi:hypothetical protein
MVPGFTRKIGSRLANVGTPAVGVNVTVGAWAFAAAQSPTNSRQVSVGVLFMAVLVWGQSTAELAAHRNS